MEYHGLGSFGWRTKVINGAFFGSDGRWSSGQVHVTLYPEFLKEQAATVQRAENICKRNASIGAFYNMTCLNLH